MNLLLSDFVEPGIKKCTTTLHIQVFVQFDDIGERSQSNMHRFHSASRPLLSRYSSQDTSLWFFGFWFLSKILQTFKRAIGYVFLTFRRYQNIQTFRLKPIDFENIINYELFVLSLIYLNDFNSWNLLFFDKDQDKDRSMLLHLDD